MRILDIGCGQKPLRNATHGVDVLMPRHVHFPTPDFEYVWRNLLQMPWFEDEEPFDKVYASHILEHFERRDALRLVEEVYRLLKPGGLFEVRVPNLVAVAKWVVDGKNPEEMAWMPMGSHPPVAWLFGMDLSDQTGTGFPFNKHRWAYTPDTLISLMRECRLHRDRECIKDQSRWLDWEIHHIYQKQEG